MDAPDNRNLLRRALPIAAFAVVLFVATFFVGDTGVYNDDYFLNQRDPVTGEIDGLVMNRPWHLWRPMTRRVLPPLVTTLWNHPWALHAISAGLHAAVVGLVYGLLRRFRIRAGIAGPCALLFMVYPVHFEAVLWSSIICTLMSVVLVMGIWHVYVWWLTTRQNVAGLARLGVLPAMGVSAWCAAAFNEQPPGALAVLPLAVMVVGLAEGETFAKRVRRSVMPVLAVGVGLGWYLVGFFKHQIGRPRPETPKRPRVGMLEHVAEICQKIPGEMGLRDFAKGAFAEGVKAIGAHPVMAAATLGVLVVLACVWAFGPREERGANEGPRRNAAGWMVVLGIGWMCVAWIPVAAAHSVTTSRLYYVPSIGCAIALAGVWSLLAGAMGARKSRAGMRAAARLALCAVIGAALVVWIGVEANMRRRFEMDRAEIRPIVDAVGATLEPDSFLVPVRIDSRSTMTGSERFDGYFQSCWYWEFASGWRAQAALRSSRVYTFQSQLGIGESLWISPDDPLHYGMIRAKSARPKPPGLATLLPQYEKEGRLIAWDRAVFFETPEAGVTRVFTKLRLHLADGVVEVVPRQIGIARPKVALPELVLDVYGVPGERKRAN